MNTYKQNTNRGNALVVFLIIAAIYVGITSLLGSDSGSSYPTEDETHTSDYEMGREWAEDNGIEDFSDCDNEFGSGADEENGCNDYIQDNAYEEDPTFHGHECTEDCGGHEAGYYWAEENGIYDTSDCYGNSSSFEEGCQAYVEENY